MFDPGGISLVLRRDRHESDAMFARAEGVLEGQRLGPISGRPVDDKSFVADLIGPSYVRISGVAHGLAVQPRYDRASLGEHECSGVPRPTVQCGFAGMAFQAGVFTNIFCDPLLLALE